MSNYLKEPMVGMACGYVATWLLSILPGLVAVGVILAALDAKRLEAVRFVLVGAVARLFVAFVVIIAAIQSQALQDVFAGNAVISVLMLGSDIGLYEKIVPYPPKRVSTIGISLR